MNYKVNPTVSIEKQLNEFYKAFFRHYGRPPTQNLVRDVFQAIRRSRSDHSRYFGK